MKTKMALTRGEAIVEGKDGSCLGIKIKFVSASNVWNQCVQLVAVINVSPGYAVNLSVMVRRLFTIRLRLMRPCSRAV